MRNVIEHAIVVGRFMRNNRALSDTQDAKLMCPRDNNCLNRITIVLIIIIDDNYSSRKCER